MAKNERFRGPGRTIRGRSAALLAIALALTAGAPTLIGAGGAVASAPGVPPLGPSVAGAATWPVAFVESGLANATLWDVVVVDNASSGSAWNVSALAPSPISLDLASAQYSYTVYGPPGETASPNPGSFGVVGASVTIAIAFTNRSTTYPVDFVEAGLPSGTAWSVDLAGQLSSTLSSTAAGTLTVSEPNGSYAFTVPSVGRYAPSPASGSLLVAGAALSVAITFAPSIPAYNVTFQETGLTAGASWSVDLGGGPPASTTGTSLGFVETDGTYLFNVSAPTGFACNPTYGTLVVAGASVVLPLVFTATGPATLPYAVVFTESNLTNGTMWSVALTQGVYAAQSSTGTSITFSLANGTYAYSVSAVNVPGPNATGFVAVPNNGTITVAGASLTIAIAFRALPPITVTGSAGLYAVTFIEIGLPAFTLWGLTFAPTSHAIAPSLSQNTTSANLLFWLANGSYAYAVKGSAGYGANPPNGTVTVLGLNLTVGVNFTAPTPSAYTVEFLESGLPNGTAWGIDLAGASQNSSGPAIVFVEGQGTYAFTDWVANSSWQTLSQNGSVAVGPGSSSLVVSIVFAAAAPAVFVANGSPAGVGWTLAVSGTATVDGLRLAPGDLAVHYLFTAASEKLVVSLPLGQYSYRASSAAAAWDGRTVTGSLSVSSYSTTTTGFQVGSSGATGPSGTSPGLPMIWIEVGVVAAAGSAIALLWVRPIGRRPMKRSPRPSARSSAATSFPSDPLDDTL